VGQRKSSHATLLDIARACGFSVSTVSIVLNETPLSQKVAAATRERVRAMAQELGYYPDAYARSLRRQRTHTIAVLAYDLSDPYCTPIIRGIQAGMQPTPFLPLLMDARTERKLFNSYLKMALERRAEGVIVVANWIFEETDLLADIEKNHVPTVIVSRDLTAKNISSLLIDNEAGGALAMRHLSELGHRNIAVIRGPVELFDSDLRWAGVQRAAAECDIRLDPRLVFQLQDMVGPASGFEGGLLLTRQMLASGCSFTAILAFDDLTALGVARGLNEAGLRVPEDCSVVGFDDVPPAAMATPAITTIRQPLMEMGSRAAQWTLKAIEAPETTEKSAPLLYKASPELVVRMSSGPPRRKVSIKSFNRLHRSPQ
jgi:DNA-binding LacI/PurR family transcriptional regulator